MNARQAWEDLERYARERDYAGYDKFDALMSPAVASLTGWSRLARMVAVQGVLRSPWNVRPLLGTRIERNPKGIALFIRGYATMNDSAAVDELARWLLLRTSPGFGNACWGYQFPWPGRYFDIPARYPNAIVTTFAAEALLDAHRLTGREEYLSTASEAARFLLALPRLIDEPERLCIGYVPPPPGLDHPLARVININAVIAGFLARLSSRAADPSFLGDARRLLRYVVEQQQVDGGWRYTDPPGASHIECDNYHTGGILDGFMDVLEADPDPELRRSFTKGRDFYEHFLFEEDGFPRWERRAKYPADAHGAAQGIITMVRAGRIETARKIVRWTLDHLRNSDGSFAFQKGRFLSKRFPLMRWSNAWIFRALALFVAEEGAS